MALSDIIEGVKGIGRKALPYVALAMGTLGYASRVDAQENCDSRYFGCFVETPYACYYGGWADIKAPNNEIVPVQEGDEVAFFNKTKDPRERTPLGVKIVDVRWPGTYLQEVYGPDRNSFEGDEISMKIAVGPNHKNDALRDVPEGTIYAAKKRPDSEVPNTWILYDIREETNLETYTKHNGDIDNDKDTDLMDFAKLQSCFTGPGNGVGVPIYGQGCEKGDLDEDGDVDLHDYLKWHDSEITGPLKKPKP